RSLETPQSARTRRADPTQQGSPVAPLHAPSRAAQRSGRLARELPRLLGREFRQPRFAADRTANQTKDEGEKEVTTMHRPLTITAQGDRELVMTREFAAPAQLVFDAWTKPELLQRWLGIRAGWTMPICEVDLRVGGKYRWVWRKEAKGMELTVRGEYREIVEP